MKFPIEIEITNYCLLKCKFCPNKSFKKRGFMDFTFFKKIIDYILINKKNILFIDFCGIGDIFLHPKFELFLLYMEKKLSGTGIDILIPTKGNSVTPYHLNLINNSYSKGLNINISVGFYSLNKKVHDSLSGAPNFINIINFIKNLKSIKMPFTIEILINKYSIKELDYFYKFGEFLGVNCKVHNCHNFGGTIKSNNEIIYNSSEYKFDCSFKEGNKFRYSKYCIGPMPLISFDGFLYFCTHGGKQTKFKGLKILNLLNRHKNISDLFNYAVSSINPDLCSKCTYFNK